MPKYKGIDFKQSLLHDEVPIFFIENDGYFNRDFLYGTEEGDYPDNLERFSYFSRW
jgi:starch synthase